jgi:glutamate racemase
LSVPAKPLRIGIRDSGVGGLTVARCVRQVLPAASLLYFADTAHVPYGERSPAEVRHFALSISQFLIAQGAQIMVFACNTSSAYALLEARRTLSTPVIGMIEPGARAAVAASRSGRIGVLATQATVNSGVYTQWLKRLSPGVDSYEVACPDFVPLVESEQTQSVAAHQASWRYLQPLLDASVDTIILGCTHYPLLLPALQAAAPHLRFVDPAEAVATEVAALAARLPDDPVLEHDHSHVGREYSEASPEASGDVFYVSGESEGVCHWVQKLLPTRAGTPHNAPDMRRGPVFDCKMELSTSY